MPFVHCTNDLFFSIFFRVLRSLGALLLVAMNCESREPVWTGMVDGTRDFCGALQRRSSFSIILTSEREKPHKNLCVNYIQRRSLARSQNISGYAHFCCWIRKKKCVYMVEIYILSRIERREKCVAVPFSGWRLLLFFFFSAIIYISSRLRKPWDWILSVNIYILISAHTPHTSNSAANARLVGFWFVVCVPLLTESTAVEEEKKCWIDEVFFFASQCACLC